MRVRELEMKRRREGGGERRRERESLYRSQFLRLFGSLLMVGLCTANAFAQRATGAITGRVVADDGQPVRHATISISSMGGGGRLTVISDEDGNFQAEGLDSVPYVISATSPGLLIVPNRQR